MSLNLPFRENFARLIALPSVSSPDPALDQSNKSTIDYLSNILEDFGFAVEQIPVCDHAGKYNLVAQLGEGNGGLVLSGHTDTVPFDPDKWTQDPFCLTEKDNRYYGLGVSDMKCFFPIAMEVIKDIDSAQLHQPLYILATADEESNMSGARALAGSGKTLGRYALIGEPTGLKPIYMHKGIIMESITVTGLSGHSSNPGLGRNALDGMHRVMHVLMEWRKDLQKKFINEHFEVPYPTLNFGSIRGGDNPNRICAQCELQIDLRFLPETSIEEIRSQLHQKAKGALMGTDLAIEFRPVFGGVPPLQTSANSEILKIAEKLSGHPASTVAFGTEAPYLSQMGMETVILGPGNIDQAHRPDEYLEIKRIKPMMRIVSGLIQHLCVKEKKDVNAFI